MNVGRRPFKFAVFVSVILSFSVLALNYMLISDYYKLQSSYPLENITVTIDDPVSLSESPYFVAHGSYTRKVMCQLYDFTVVLHNVDTHDKMLITVDNLVKSPPTYLYPATGIPITFETRLPHGIYPGTWLPTFEGKYFCTQGIFMHRKTQTIPTHAIQIVE